MKPPVAEPPQPFAVVRDRVHRALARSSEFRALPAERQSALIRDMVHAGAAAARALARRHGAADAPPTALEESVDFPSFVADLVHGTFEAIVDASVRQMQAYTELLRNVAKPLDEFMCDNVPPGHGRDDAARRRLATQRQQVLSTMVLMGINRIVVTDGRITASVAYELPEAAAR